MNHWTLITLANLFYCSLFQAVKSQKLDDFVPKFDTTMTYIIGRCIEHSSSRPNVCVSGPHHFYGESFQCHKPLWSSGTQWSMKWIRLPTEYRILVRFVVFVLASSIIPSHLLIGRRRSAIVIDHVVLLESTRKVSLQYFSSISMCQCCLHHGCRCRISVPVGQPRADRCGLHDTPQQQPPPTIQSTITADNPTGSIKCFNPKHFFSSFSSPAE